MGGGTFKQNYQVKKEVFCTRLWYDQCLPRNKVIYSYYEISQFLIHLNHVYVYMSRNPLYTSYSRQRVIPSVYVMQIEAERMFYTYMYFAVVSFTER